MPRIPGSAERARALAYLAWFLSQDEEFRRLASELRKSPGSELAPGISQIRNRLGLPDREWIYDYLSELNQHFDDALFVRTFVRHWRSVREFEVVANGRVRSFLVDPESSSSWVASNHSLVNGQWTLWPLMPPAAPNLSHLEAFSHSPRRARRWWRANKLPRGRKPTETLKRNVLLLYLRRWRRLSLVDVAVEVDEDASAVWRVRPRSQRGLKRLAGGARAYAHEPLSGAAIRKALGQIDRLLR